MINLLGVQLKTQNASIERKIVKLESIDEQIVKRDLNRNQQWIIINVLTKIKE